MRVLEGVTVLDFTQAYSGPFCTMQLADFGARVIKIERRGVGDQSREWAPFTEDGYSGYYASINRNKESLSLDISKPEGAALVKEMIKKADILVENFKVGTMEKMGLGYDEIKKINPKIIYASITGFGQDGPLKGLAAYDNIVQAMSGIMEMTGFPDGLPTRVGPAIGDNVTGLTMSLGICLAYYHMLSTGEGQRIDVAMLDTIFGMLESPIIFNELQNIEVTRTGNNDAATLVPYDVYKCKDGYFSAGLAGEKGWDKFCETIQMPELINDERFKDNALRCKHYKELTEIMQVFFLDKTREELGEMFTKNKIPNAPVLSIPEVLQHPQVIAREMVTTIKDPGIGEYCAVTNPMKLSLTPATIVKAAPLMGEDTRKVLADFGFSADEIEKLYSEEII